MPPAFEVEERVSPRRWQRIEVTFHAADKEAAEKMAASIYGRELGDVRAKRVR